jgi:hypothetical protein
MWTKLHKIIALFTQKILIKILKNIVLGSGIWKKPILDPGSRVKKAPDTGSWLPDPQHFMDLKDKLITYPTLMDHLPLPDLSQGVARDPPQS